MPSLHLPSGIDERIADRYIALCEASRVRGEPAEHCDGATCANVCRCACVPCMRATAYLAEARRWFHPAVRAGRRQG